jgi:chemotaxis signal transduction protein
MHDLLKKLEFRSSSASSTHYVVVGIGAETFGVPASQLREIVGLGDLDPAPRLPKNLTGPVRVLEKVIFLVKLQAAFARHQGEPEITPRTCVLVLKAPSAISLKSPRGVVVDRVERIIELGDRDIEIVQTRRKGLWATCMFGFARRHLPVILLDLETLVSPEEANSGTPPAQNTESGTTKLKRRLPE